MASAWDNYTFRPTTLDDAKQVLELIDRCEIAEYGASDSSMDDLLNDWEQVNLAQDSWLALTPAGELAGYATVMPWIDRLRYDFFNDPILGSEALGQALLARCEARGAILASSGSISWSKSVIYIAEINQRNRNLLEGAGFRVVRHHFQMQIMLLAPPPLPRWPEGIKLTTVQPHHDMRDVHNLVETSFARPGRKPTSFEIWSKLMLREDIFDPSLWFLAYAEQELAGVCLGFVYPELGWVRQLAVKESWRRRGLGSALLQHAFSKFYQRGYPKAGLGVDAENSKAYSLYEKVGMQRIRQYNEYEKEIQPKNRLLIPGI